MIPFFDSAVKPVKHTCPRRGEPGPFKLLEGEDTWEIRPNGDRCCSFCGSLHPEDFLKLVQDALSDDSKTDIEPSTKGYKIYVHRVGISNATEGGIKFYTMHGLDGEWLEEMKRIYQQAVKNSNNRWMKRFKTFTKA